MKEVQLGYLGRWQVSPQQPACNQPVHGTAYPESQSKEQALAVLHRCPCCRFVCCNAAWPAGAPGCSPWLLHACKVVLELPPPGLAPVLALVLVLLSLRMRWLLVAAPLRKLRVGVRHAPAPAGAPLLPLPLPPLQPASVQGELSAAGDMACG